MGIPPVPSYIARLHPLGHLLERADKPDGVNQSLIHSGGKAQLRAPRAKALIVSLVAPIASQRSAEHGATLLLGGVWQGRLAHRRIASCSIRSSLGKRPCKRRCS